MNLGVPLMNASRRDVVSAASPGVKLPRARSIRLCLLALTGLLALVVPGSALAAGPSVGLGSAASFSVLGGSTVTNTGPTTMFGDLGLSPGSSVTGAPLVLGATHIDDAVAIGAKSALTTAYNDAASRPTSGSAGTDLAGQTFTPGVRTASGSLLLSAGSVTLDAQGDPNAVFIFQIGSTLITESNTSVSLINGAQACNVFWQVASSATLGTGTRFVGTVMAAETITAGTAATIHGRLLAETAAVNLDTNTITTSNCASSVSGGGGGIETISPTEIPTPPAGTPAPVVTATPTPVPASGSAPVATSGPTTSTPIGSQSAITSRQRAAKRRAARRRAEARRAAARRAARRRATHTHSQARPATPTSRGGFTG